MLYTIRLEDMEFRAYHGCYDLEREVGNRFNVRLAITAELGDAADEDDVERTVNYLTVYETVREQMAVKQRTIERVAQNIVETECTVAKLAPPLGGKVGRVSVTMKG